MTQYLVLAEDLDFAYPDGHWALRSVSFRVASGEKVAVIGPNGAGKSTLLLHLNGLLQASRGRVQIGDLTITRQTLPSIRRKVGMIFQDPDDQLFMPTVLEDVAFGPLQHGLDRSAALERASAALQRVGMAHVSDHPPWRLSAGEKRAVAIAGVLALDPDILVMDEPSTHLDPRARRRLIELLRSFHHTLIIATHDLELVVEVCSRALLLDGGRLIADGAVVELLNDEALMLEHGLERPHILRHRHPHD